LLMVLLTIFLLYLSSLFRNHLSIFLLYLYLFADYVLYRHIIQRGGTLAESNVKD
jgi:hypothetical protein